MDVVMDPYLYVLLIQCLHTIKLAQIELELDVALEERLLRAHPCRRPEDLARSSQLQLPYLEPCEHDPQFRKRKLLVRHYPDRSLVDLARAIVVLRAC